MKECETYILTYTYKHFRLRRDEKSTRSIGVLVFSRALTSPGCPLVIKERVSAEYHFTRIQLRNTQLVRETFFEFICYMCHVTLIEKGTVFESRRC